MARKTLSFCLIIASTIFGAWQNAEPKQQQPLVQSSAPQPAQSVVSIPLSTPGPASSPAAGANADKVPEMMKRAMTKEEMEKALQAMPPEVRKRIQGLAPAPPNAVPTAAPKKKQ
ncbi:MAG: hypothetical protein IPL01_09715 [Acidobacteria bacterium]|nr:hypothetical protein [Acidobacteriota bacterium]